MIKSLNCRQAKFQVHILFTMVKTGHSRLHDKADLSNFLLVIRLLNIHMSQIAKWYLHRKKLDEHKHRASRTEEFDKGKKTNQI